MNHGVVFGYLSPGSKQNYLRLMEARRKIRRNLLDVGFLFYLLMAQADELLFLSLCGWEGHKKEKEMRN